MNWTLAVSEKDVTTAKNLGVSYLYTLSKCVDISRVIQNHLSREPSSRHLVHSVSQENPRIPTPIITRIHKNPRLHTYILSKRHSIGLHCP